MNEALRPDELLRILLLRGRPPAEWSLMDADEWRMWLHYVEKRNARAPVDE